MTYGFLVRPQGPPEVLLIPLEPLLLIQVLMQMIMDTATMVEAHKLLLMDTYVLQVEVLQLVVRLEAVVQ